MRNTLGLDDDLDSVELIQDLKAAFAVEFSDTETESCRTVGDIFALLMSRVSNGDISSRRCAGAMTFYRLRRALKDAGVQRKLTPASKLDDLSSLSPKELFRTLQSYTSLRLPRLRDGWRGLVGVAIILLAILGSSVLAAIKPGLLPYSIAMFVVGTILLRFDRGIFPPECNTLGELTIKVVGLNFGELTALGAGFRGKELWRALLEVLAEHSSLPKTEMTPDTLLLQSQLRSI